MGCARRIERVFMHSTGIRIVQERACLYHSWDRFSREGTRTHKVGLE